MILYINTNIKLVNLLTPIPVCCLKSNYIPLVIETANADAESNCSSSSRICGPAPPTGSGPWIFALLLW